MARMPVRAKDGLRETIKSFAEEYLMIRVWFSR